MTELLKNTRPANSIALTDAADRRCLIQSFVHRNHNGRASLAELANTLRLSESRASHLVKELFGCSYVQLVNEIRLRSAASLLRDTALTVMEVGLNSGFRDLSHFHRCFQRRFGMTPRRYRLTSRT